jgi:putative addiction module antidote
MEEIKVKLRKWGNSIGVVIPQEVLKNNNKKEGDEVTILMPKENNVLREMFGTLKAKKSTEQIMKEIDKELYND